MNTDCGGGCGNRSWSAETRQRWSEDHATKLVDAARLLAPPQPFPIRPLRQAELVDPIERVTAGHSAREYAGWLVSRCRGPERAVAASPSDTRALRTIDTISLGHSPRWGPLIATLPRGQRAVTHGASMFAELFPQHDHSGFRWQVAAAEASVIGLNSERPGLFWSGPASPHRAAWGLAVLQIRQGRLGRPLVLGPMPDQYKDRVEPDRAEIRIDGDGVVRLARLSPLHSWASSQRNHALEQARGVAAMADYHMWWAHRLQSHYHADSRSPFDLMLATVAARRSMYWVARLGAELRHMDGHEVSS